MNTRTLRYQVAVELTDGSVSWSASLDGDAARERWAVACGRFGHAGYAVAAAFLLKDGIVVASARHHVEDEPPGRTWTEVDSEVVDGNDTPIRLSTPVRVF